MFVGLSNMHVETITGLRVIIQADASRMQNRSAERCNSDRTPSYQNYHALTISLFIARDCQTRKQYLPVVSELVGLVCI